MSSTTDTNVELQRRTREIVEHALALDHACRAPYLNQALADAPELRLVIERTLRRIDNIDSAGWAQFIEDRTEALVPTETSTEWSPLRAGRYHIVEKLAEGGQGIVYMARQENPQRLVALKVLHTKHLPEDAHVQLFQREVHTLAQLNHPSIATIFESGRLETGEHYYTMELIRGITLDEWLRTQQPSHSQRVEMFLKICAAVEYAHGRGIIHRDLKPANILVTPDATPKILDFGMARLVNDEMPSASSQPGNVLGTVAYMSPEQAEGNLQNIDIRSDVYALGIICYEMLTGQKPFSLDGYWIGDAIRMVIEQQPIPPSAVDSELRGDLEAIILKALAKDRRERYSCIANLIRDIERHRNHLPVEAAEPTRWYALTKFIRRNRTVSALTGMVFVLALALGIYAPISAHRLAQKNEDLLSSFRVLNDSFRIAAEAALREDETGKTIRRMLDTMHERVETGGINSLIGEAFIRETLCWYYGHIGDMDLARHHADAVLHLRAALSDRSPEELLALLGKYGPSSAAGVLRTLPPPEYQAPGRDKDISASVLQLITNSASQRERTIRELRTDEPVVREQYGLHSDQRIDLLYRLATTLLDAGKFDEAADASREVLQIAIKRSLVNLRSGFRVIRLRDLVALHFELAELRNDDADRQLAAEALLRHRTDLARSNKWTTLRRGQQFAEPHTPE